MAQRATSLGPKPSLLFIAFFGGGGCVFCFPLFAFNRENLIFPLRMSILFIVQCLPLFLLSLFPPLFTLSLSLSLSCSFLSFFLPSSLSVLLYFASLFFFIFVCFFLLFLCLCFMKRTTSKY